MTDNIITLTPVTQPIQPVDDEVVSDLRMLLAKAEAGEIQGLAFITIRSTGTGTVISTGSGYAGEGLRQNPFVAIGKAEHLKMRLLQLIEGLF